MMPTVLCFWLLLFSMAIYRALTVRLLFIKIIKTDMILRNCWKTTNKEHNMFNIVTQQYIFNTATITTFGQFECSFSVKMYNSICKLFHIFLCKYKKFVTYFAIINIYPMDNVKIPTIKITQPLITAQKHRRNIT